MSCSRSLPHVALCSTSTLSGTAAGRQWPCHLQQRPREYFRIRVCTPLPQLAADERVCESQSGRLVIFDEHFGIEPHATAASRCAQVGVPLWLCDTATTVPSALLSATALSGGNAGFLRTTTAARSARLADEHWMPPPAAAPPHPPPAELPAWAVDLKEEGAIEAVLAAPSRRDTSVTRVRHTQGGPKAALARWSAYVKGGGLRSYASHRNNPLAPDGKGASRMSAYVNCGMIDPCLMARDAQAAGADKFLSEFCGFRESSYLWCLLNPGGYADASAAVPSWAQGQLHAAAVAAAADGGVADASTPDLADIEAGRTGDRYWDDCQRSLVLSGELHNNVRMAWGKAIPAWHAASLRGGDQSRSPLPPTVSRTPSSAAARLQAALDMLIRLNDRFALDGGAPPSYAGLLWCLGWRDRPGSGGCPTRRPTSVMASRIKPGDLEKRARQRCGGQMASFIGGASSGHSCPPASSAAAASPAPPPPAAGHSSTSSVAPTPPTGEALLADEDPSIDECQRTKATGLLLQGDRPPAPKRQRVAPAGGSAANGSLMHWLNRESAAALPPSGRRP